MATTFGPARRSSPAVAEGGGGLRVYHIDRGYERIEAKPQARRRHHARAGRSSQAMLTIAIWADPRRSWLSSSVRGSTLPCSFGGSPPRARRSRVRAALPAARRTACRPTWSTAPPIGIVGRDVLLERDFTTSTLRSISASAAAADGRRDRGGAQALHFAHRDQVPEHRRAPLGRRAHRSRSSTCGIKSAAPITGSRIASSISSRAARRSIRTASRTGARVRRAPSSSRTAGLKPSASIRPPSIA